MRRVSDCWRKKKARGTGDVVHSVRGMEPGRLSALHTYPAETATRTEMGNTGVPMKKVRCSGGCFCFCFWG